MSNRLGFIAELGVLFGLSCLAGAVFNGGDFAFLSTPLHPFLLVIAILSVQYGLSEALLATGVALVLYASGVWASQAPLGGGIYVMFSFVATGMILGLTQEGRNRQQRQTRSELEEMRNEAERLRQRLQVVNAANQRLNERILGEVSTVQSFSEIARRLSVLEERDLYPAICALTQEFVHATEASVYMLSGEKLVLTAQKGWETVPPEAQVLGPDQSLVWRALEGKAPLTALDPGAPTASPNTRLMCAPIVHPETGQAMGVISVDRLPFSHFHGSSVSVLGVIAKWAGDSLYNAATFREVASQLTGDDLVRGCVAPVLFRDRAQQELAKNRQAGLVTLLLQGYHLLDPTAQAELRQRLDGVLQPHLSKEMSLGRLAEGLYGILVKPAEAEGLRAKLVAGVRAEVTPSLDSRVSVMIGSAALAEGDAAMERLVAFGSQNLTHVA